MQLAKFESQTMSSREIAELTGTQHKHVLENIRKVLEECEIDSAGFSAQYKDSTGRVLPCFNLPRRECDLIIAGYSAKYRLAIIDRWQELENETAFTIPSTLSGALRLASEQAEKLEAQSILLEEQKPKVAALERISQSVHENNMRDAAKVLQIKPGSMSGWLASLRWVSKGNGKHWFALQPAIDSGYMITRENEQEMEDGSVKIRPQAMVTQKGIEKLALMLAKAPSCNINIFA